MAEQSEDIAAIKQLAEDWHAGWIAGDYESLPSLYADDPVLMPQNQPRWSEGKLSAQYISPSLRNSPSKAVVSYWRSKWPVTGVWW